VGRWASPIRWWHIDRGEIDVAPQIGRVPVEGRRIRHDAKRVVVNPELPVDRFDHHRLAGAVVYHEVNRRRLLDGIKHDGQQHHLIEIRFHLVDVREISQQPCRVFMRRHGARLVFPGRFGIAREAGEVESADVQTLVVQAVDDDRQPDCVGAGHAVFRLVADALGAVRR